MVKDERDLATLATLTLILTKCLFKVILLPRVIPQIFGVFIQRNSSILNSNTVRLSYMFRVIYSRSFTLIKFKTPSNTPASEIVCIFKKNIAESMDEVQRRKLAFRPLIWA